MKKVYEDQIAQTFTNIDGQVNLEAHFSNYGERGYVDVYCYDRPSNTGHLVEIKSGFTKANTVIRQLKKYEENFFDGSKYYADNKRITFFVIANKQCLKSLQKYFTLFKNWLRSENEFSRFIRIGLPEDSKAFNALTLSANTLEDCESLSDWFWKYYEEPSNDILCESAQRIKGVCDIDLDEFVEPHQRQDERAEKTKPISIYERQQPVSTNVKE